MARSQFTAWGIEARLDRIEALLVRLQPPDDPALLPALAEATGGEWFTLGDAWRLARAEATAAAADGLPEPSLSVALRRNGIGGAHALGRWLALQPGVERGGEERGGVLWRVCGFDPPNPRETA